MYYFHIVESMCIVHYAYWSSGPAQSKLPKKKSNLAKPINPHALGVSFFYRLVVFKVDTESSGIWGMFSLWSSTGRKIELEIISSIFN